MVSLGIIPFVRAAHVMQERRSHQHVNVDVFFAFGDLDGVVQHPVNMLSVMGAVLHADEHVFFQQVPAVAVHRRPPF